jgi:hypothetical protein
LAVLPEQVHPWVVGAVVLMAVQVEMDQRDRAAQEEQRQLTPDLAVVGAVLARQADLVEAVDLVT